jgi:catechol 2,3-dioxygenase-like lactoylglutathione lyase family enzyme
MITPVLRVRDVDLSLRFYTQILGFKGEGGLPGFDGRTVYAEAYLGESKIIFTRIRSALPSHAELYIHLPEGIDIGWFYGYLRAREVPICEDMREELWGDQAFTITDFDGVRLTFAQPVRRAALPATPALLKEVNQGEESISAQSRPARLAS